MRVSDSGIEFDPNNVRWGQRLFHQPNQTCPNPSLLYNDTYGGIFNKNSEACINMERFGLPPGIATISLFPTHRGWCESQPAKCGMVYPPEMLTQCLREQDSEDPVMSQIASEERLRTRVDMSPSFASRSASLFSSRGTCQKSTFVPQSNST